MFEIQLLNFFLSCTLFGSILSSFFMHRLIHLFLSTGYKFSPVHIPQILINIMLSLPDSKRNCSWYFDLLFSLTIILRYIKFFKILFLTLQICAFLLLLLISGYILSNKCTLYASNFKKCCRFLHALINRYFIVMVPCVFVGYQVYFWVPLWKFTNSIFFMNFSACLIFIWLWDCEFFLVFISDLFYVLHKVRNLFSWPAAEILVSFF